MAKRFTDTNKYKKPFVRGLQGAYKLFWDYLYHDCDHAGIWIVDFEIAQLYLGKDMPVNRKDALEFFNNGEERIIEFDNGKKWFIKSFIEFQYGILNPQNRVHFSVISELKKHNLDKGLVSTLQGAKDKDTIKDMETLKEDDVHESYQDIALDQKLPFRFSQQSVRDFFKSEYDGNITDPDALGFADIGTYITKNGAGGVFLDNIRRFKHLITFHEYKYLLSHYKFDNKYIKNVILQCEEIPKYISQSLNNTIIRWSNKEFNK
jgi:hypothetical protein